MKNSKRHFPEKRNLKKCARTRAIITHLQKDVMYHGIVSTLHNHEFGERRETNAPFYRKKDSTMARGLKVPKNCQLCAFKRFYRLRFNCSHSRCARAKPLSQFATDRLQRIHAAYTLNGIWNCWNSDCCSSTELLWIPFEHPILNK